jgi:asparagine synthase (glutamine-hydrolysing)
MLEDLFELPAGHILTVSADGSQKMERYFFFEEEEEQDETLPDDEWIKIFKEKFKDAVCERLPDNEEVGLFLSGGLDSSIIAAELVKHYKRPLKTFSIHFGSDLPNELEFASAVAKRLGTDHEEVLIKPQDFLPRMRQMIWYLDEPIGDPITMPNFELSRHVSRSLRWVYNGEGGDPLFGGPKNFTMLLHHWYGGIERENNFRERMYLASYRRCYSDLERLLTPDWKKQFCFTEDLESILTPYFNCERPKSFLNKLMSINIRLKGAHLILPKVERMTGAWGLTPLSPLFDEELLRLSFRIPPKMKLRHGTEKIILKEAFRDELPAEVIDRPKSGMRVPVHYWFKGELQRYARHILSPQKLSAAGIFDPERVKQLLDYSIEEGPGRYGLRLWMIITFEIWRRGGGAFAPFQNY